MSRVSFLLVLLSLVTSNIYIADSYTLTASVLNQLGYNNQSWFININDNNIDSIDPNAFNGYDTLDSIRLDLNSLLTIDLEVFKYAANITGLFLHVPSLNKFTNSKNVKFPYITGLTLYTNLISLNKAMFNAFPALRYFRTGEYSIGYSSSLKTVDVHTFESLSNLTNLDLQLNSLTAFEYLQIPKNLKNLNLAGNKMNYFALSRTMGVLDYLDISANRFRSFKSMDFTFLANLTQLDLYSNPHAYPNEFSGHMKPLVKLERIDFRNLSINKIDSTFFKTNTKLKRIDLSYNKISSLDSGAFDGLNDLNTILLNANNLTKIASGTFKNPSLITIDVAGNEISQLDESSFYGYPNYRVNLNANKITKILPRSFCNQFQSIALQGNEITEIENTTFDGVIRIDGLLLTDNKIEKIAPNSFKNISSVDLGNNRLRELKNGTFVGTISLSLWGNRIEKIEADAFKYANLTGSINLSYNLLTGINKTMFVGQNQLQSIYLNNNFLSKIESGAFANLPNLNAVHLQNNALTYLDGSMFAGSNKLNYIYLKSNPGILNAYNKTTLQSMLCPPAATNCQIIDNF